MEWKAVAVDGLPEKNFDEDGTDYLVVIDEFDKYRKKHTYEVDIATFDSRYGYIDDCWTTVVDWKEGNEIHVIYYCKVELPAELWKQVSR